MIEVRDASSGTVHVGPGEGECVEGEFCGFYIRHRARPRSYGVSTGTERLGRCTAIRLTIEGSMPLAMASASSKLKTSAK